MTIIEALSNLELATLVGQTPESLKITYLGLVNKIHPDKGGSTNHFIRVQQSYDTLLKELKVIKENAGLDNLKAELSKANLTISNYQKLFNQQADLIKESSNSLDNIHCQYSIISDKLTEALQSELSELDHRRNIPWWKVMIGVSPMTQVSYNQQYNQIITHYNKILDQANDQFITQLLETYKTINNELVEILSKV